MDKNSETKGDSGSDVIYLFMWKLKVPVEMEVKVDEKLATVRTWKNRIRPKYQWLGCKVETPKRIYGLQPKRTVQTMTFFFHE